MTPLDANASGEQNEQAASWVSLVEQPHAYWEMATTCSICQPSKLRSRQMLEAVGACKGTLYQDLIV
jgi:hypothetical protein